MISSGSRGCNYQDEIVFASQRELFRHAKNEAPAPNSRQVHYSAPIQFRIRFSACCLGSLHKSLDELLDHPEAQEEFIGDELVESLSYMVRTGDVTELRVIFARHRGLSKKFGTDFPRDMNDLRKSRFDIMMEVTGGLDKDLLVLHDRDTFLTDRP